MATTQPMRSSSDLATMRLPRTCISRMKPAGCPTGVALLAAIRLHINVEVGQGFPAAVLHRDHADCAIFKLHAIAV